MTDLIFKLAKSVVMSFILVYVYVVIGIAENFVERLYTMVRDKDPQVVVNSIVVLNELLEDSGGIQVTQKMAYFLLNRINDWSEWQLSIVLDVLLKYVPSNRKEVFDIMVSVSLPRMDEFLIGISRNLDLVSK